MSMKENVNYIKEEISTQESFLENFLKIEKFYKKYKKVIFSTLGALALGFVGVSTMDYISNQNKLEANAAFNTLLENPNDQNALNTLKSKNPKLYDIAVHLNDRSKSVDVEFLKELSVYSAAVEKNSVNDISTAVQSQKFLIKDFAMFNKALIEAQNGKYKESKETLKMIPVTSSLASLVAMLEHFLLTK